MMVDFNEPKIRIPNLVGWTKVGETSAGHLGVPLLQFPESGWIRPIMSEDDWNIVVLSKSESIMQPHGMDAQQLPSRFGHRSRRLHGERLWDSLQTGARDVGTMAGNSGTCGGAAAHRWA